MPKEQIVASLDIGSSKIRTVIAILEEEKKMPNIIGVGVSPSTGMRKGNIIDVDETISNISAALEDAERMSGAPIHSTALLVRGLYPGPPKREQTGAARPDPLSAKLTTNAGIRPAEGHNDP